MTSHQFQPIAVGQCPMHIAELRTTVSISFQFSGPGMNRWLLPEQSWVLPHMTTHSVLSEISPWFWHLPLISIVLPHYLGAVRSLWCWRAVTGSGAVQICLLRCAQYRKYDCWRDRKNNILGLQLLYWVFHKHGQPAVQMSRWSSSPEESVCGLSPPQIRPCGKVQNIKPNTEGSTDCKEEIWITLTKLMLHGSEMAIDCYSERLHKTKGCYSMVSTWQCAKFHPPYR